jgi:hypothetical protein
MKVMIYTFSNTTQWWRYLASRLDFATQTVLVSDLPDADVDISESFHQNMRAPDIEREALEVLGERECQQVIARCRLLRVLDRDVAVRMIGAMLRTIEDLLDRERPDVFLCFIVDRYILDLFERSLTRRGVRYVGMAIGVLPDTFMFTARGEYVPIREPSEAEVDAAVATLAQPNFLPNYVTNTGFGLIRFLRRYGHFTARWLAFEALRLIRRVPYDYRYLSARSAKSGFRVRLRDWAVMRYFKSDWGQSLEATPFERRVFIALSVNPEAAIEYWVRDLAMIDYANVLQRAARSLGNSGFRLFVKDHPSQFGFRQVELFAALAEHPAVTFVPYEVPGQWLIDQCRATFTWTGTVGLQAAMAGRCAVVESSAYYVVDGLFIGVANPDDTDDLAGRIDLFRPALPLPEARRALARKLLRSTVPGVYLSWRGFTPTDQERVRQAETVVESLNRYLPLLATRRAA